MQLLTRSQLHPLGMRLSVWVGACTCDDLTLALRSQAQKRKKYQDGYIVVTDGRLSLFAEPAEGKKDGRLLESCMLLRHQLMAACCLLLLLLLLSLRQ
jgi:hypothetical protein